MFLSLGLRGWGGRCTSNVTNGYNGEKLSSKTWNGKLVGRYLQRRIQPQAAKTRKRNQTVDFDLLSWFSTPRLRPVAGNQEAQRCLQTSLWKNSEPETLVARTPPLVRLVHGQRSLKASIFSKARDCHLPCKDVNWFCYNQTIMQVQCTRTSEVKALWYIWLVDHKLLACW